MLCCTHILYIYILHACIHAYAYIHACYAHSTYVGGYYIGGYGMTIRMHMRAHAHACLCLCAYVPMHMHPMATRIQRGAVETPSYRGVGYTHYYCSRAAAL